MNPTKVFAIVLAASLVAGAPAPNDFALEGAGAPAPNDFALAGAGAPAAAASVPGADASWSESVASQIEREEYRVSTSAHGLQAPNRANNLRTHFRAGGIEVSPRQLAEGEKTAPWQCTWRTKHWGRVNAPRDLTPRDVEPRLERNVQPCLENDRVTYSYPGIDEWYENRKEGLEQGFTVHERPAGDGPLLVAGEFGGGLLPQLVEAEGAIDLLDEHDVRALRYGGLHVWDANGSDLPSHFALDGIEVAIVIEDEGAAYPLTIDPLLTSPVWTAESDQANTRFAASVATAGDVNGDGYSDVIVGSDRFDNGQSDEGRAFVYHGSPTGLSTTAAWTAESNQVNADFGYSVATAGDVNGDGFSDVIIGAYLYDNGETNEGRAFVYLGSASGLSPTAAWTAESEQASAQFGFSVATAGDVNGDGFSDVIVGANQFDTKGRAYVYHGSASGLSATEVWAGAGTEAFDHFAFSVSTAGDVNGDGFADVIVGSIGYSNGQSDEGRALVYHGSAGGLAAIAAWTGESGQASSFYGWSVSTAGDVNGDGYSEVIVGAVSYGNGEAGEGRAYVYNGSVSGLSTTLAWSVEPNQAGASFGGSVATAGDVNGDGFADIIVGASAYDNGQTNEGRAFVYRGSASGLSATPAWTGESDQGGAQAGVSVATAGDVNGDGFSDVIVGAFCYDNGQTDEGRAFVYHGSGESLATSAGWAEEGDQVSSLFGESVATAGDVNGDGFSDVIVGAPRYDNGQTDEGRAYVYLGSAAGLSTTAAWTAEGGQTSAHFGSSVSTAGDVNGDGYSDVIVGSIYFDNGQSEEGRAFVYLGSPSGLAAAPAWTAESNQNSAQFGCSVATAGDVNGDGFSDVIVGALDYNNDQSDEGRAFVYHGSASGLSTAAAWTSESDQSLSYFGSSVASAGDVNGDGFSDVIVGARFFDNGANDEGRAFVYHGSASGLSTTAVWTSESDQSLSYFGTSVASAGDVNGDGFSDVIVGCPDYDNGHTNEGRAFVYHGGPLGLSTTAAWTAESGQAHARFGTSVSTAGDVNGDGFSDVIVGAPAYTFNLVNEGQAFVYHGGAEGLSTTPAWAPDMDGVGAFFGISVSMAGDVNGDGFSDVIVGGDNFGIPFPGEALVYSGNNGDGLHRVPEQVRTDGAAPIPVLGLSDSPSAFRLTALGRTAAGRGWIRVQYEVAPFGTPFDDAGLISGPMLDTGDPFGNGSTVELSELVSGLSPGTLYHWRLRFVSDSPFFPRSPWFTLAGNGLTEADLATASATSVSEGGGLHDGKGVLFVAAAPNPFVHSTEIVYALPSDGLVRLIAYDVTGRRVATIAEGIQERGSHAALWDGHDARGSRVSAGVYFLSLEFGGRVDVRKVVVTR